MSQKSRQKMAGERVKRERESDSYARRPFRADRMDEAEDGEEGIPTEGSVLMSVATERTEEARRILLVASVSLLAREVREEGRLK